MKTYQLTESDLKTLLCFALSGVAEYPTLTRKLEAFSGCCHISQDDLLKHFDSLNILTFKFDLVENSFIQ